MNPEYKQALIEHKADLKNALLRVAGNEDIYERLLQKFLLDQNFSNLKTCLTTQNYENAFPYAHTLKGLAGNLGLTPIYESVDPIVELLRNNTTEGISELFLSLEQTYNDFYNLIRSYT
ncbi:MAG: Hpt domain-containing protein [Clostridiales bacterium]|nr:Hpt domain-containing protein [Clostridiales bacterium]